MRIRPHDAAIFCRCETWLARHFREPGAVTRAVGLAGLPERTLKRHFWAATGLALIDCVQNLRVEEAKRLLEARGRPNQR